MKRKLVIITEHLYGGGVERILQTICSHFNYNLYDVTLYTIREDTPNTKHFPTSINYKFIFEVIKPTHNYFERIWIKFKNKIKLFIYYNCKPSIFFNLFVREKANTAIAFIEGYATQILAGFPNEKTKKIAWLHIELERFHWSKIAFKSLSKEKEAYLSMDKIICVANIVKEQIDRLYPVKEKTIVLHNPIDREYILSQANIELPNYLNHKKFPIRLISVGSLDKRKGHDRLLKIMSKLKHENINVELWILGRGEKENELKEVIKKHSLSDRVTLFGFKENPYKYIKACDIYVCASWAEGYNTAITEALVLGKAIVSTECSGVKEQLGENNEFGICTKNNDDALYEGIKKMLNYDVINHYTKQANIRSKDFTLEKSMNSIYKLIEE